MTTSPTPPSLAATDVNDFGELCGKADHRAEPSSIYTCPRPHAIVEFGRDRNVEPRPNAVAECSENNDH